MKLYKMNDNGTFSKIAEGRVYKKGEIRLREDANGVTATLKGGATNVAQGMQKAKQVMAANSNVDDVSIDAGNLDGHTDSTSGEGMKINIPTNASASELNIATQAARNPQTKDAKINFVKPNSNMQGQTNESKGGLVFTKEEMDKFLRTI